MAAKLVAEEGDLKGLVLSLENQDSWIIGRDPEECQIVIEDLLTSRKHLVAKRTSEGISVENLSETNPLEVNDEVIGDEPRLLRQGDTLKIGNGLFRFYSDLDTHVLSEKEEDAMMHSHQDQETTDNENTTGEHLNGTEKNQADILAEPESNEDSIFEDQNMDENSLAQINFGIAETGRWLLKVVSGPNNGAEFYMETGRSYVLGTDPHSSDIVFHDTSVSRQHAKITVTQEDTLIIEDLKSRNGVVVSGKKLEGKDALSPSVIVTLGTTSFVIYDREGEMHTIISPLLPSIVKVLQQDDHQPHVAKTPIETTVEETQAAAQAAAVEAEAKKPHLHVGPLIILTVVIGLFVLAGIATTSLFKSEPVVMETQENASDLIQQTLKPFPALKFSFNKSNGGLLLLGHLATAADMSQLTYTLQGMKFIKNIDSSGVVIDEYVWQEINSILSKNPAWKGISIHSTDAGHFVLAGYLETRKQAEQLSDYISTIFPYLDLLKKEIVVEEDVLGQISNWTQELGLRNITAKMNNGEVTLSGNAPSDRDADTNRLIAKIKAVPGVRIVNNLIRSQAPEMGIINISDQYMITGQSRLGDRFTVVINGRILSEGDILDGMTITSIKPNAVFLEKDGTKYRIDYSK